MVRRSDDGHAAALSVRTIEGHVYRASCKAGVTRRSDLTDVMRDLLRTDTVGPAVPVG